MNLHNPVELAKFAAALQRKHTDELGFLPTVALREYAERGQIIPASENDEPIGYVLYFDGRAGKPPAKHPDRVKLHQVCIQYDARGIYHGTQLVREVERRARTHGFSTVTAWVASDLPANQFWRAIGYELNDTRPGGKRRNRIHNLWIRHIGTNRPDVTIERIGNSPIEHHLPAREQPAIVAPTSTRRADGSRSTTSNFTGGSE
jgi:GNAT superfamily N-acetyltransferase